MAVERAPGGTSLIDVLDRILDKGIVVDAWVRISLVGIDLITVEGITSTVARPALGEGGTGSGVGSPSGTGSTVPRT
jgi:hypothetical protein